MPIVKLPGVVRYQKPRQGVMLETIVVDDWAAAWRRIAVEGCGEMGC
jgi:hypothetical protein